MKCRSTLSQTLYQDIHIAGYSLHFNKEIILENKDTCRCIELPAIARMKMKMFRRVIRFQMIASISSANAAEIFCTDVITTSVSKKNTHLQIRKKVYTEYKLMR
jgi:hypothetical protein